MKKVEVRVSRKSGKAISLVLKGLLQGGIGLVLAYLVKVVSDTGCNFVKYPSAINFVTDIVLVGLTTYFFAKSLRNLGIE